MYYYDISDANVHHLIPIHSSNNILDFVDIDVESMPFFHILIINKT